MLTDTEYARVNVGCAGCSSVSESPGSNKTAGDFFIPSRAAYAFAMALSERQSRHLGEQAGQALVSRLDRCSPASVVVEVRLDITADHAAQCADQVIDLSRVGAAHGIRNAHSVHANCIYGGVNRPLKFWIGGDETYQRPCIG